MPFIKDASTDKEVGYRKVAFLLLLKYMIFRASSQRLWKSFVRQHTPCRAERDGLLRSERLTMRVWRTLWKERE